MYLRSLTRLIGETVQVQHFGLRHRLRILKRIVTESVNVGDGFVTLRTLIKSISNTVNISLGFVWGRSITQAVGD